VKLPRRKFLHLAAGVAALPAVSRIASADTYPSRPVRWIVGFPPGGPNDIAARIMAEFLSERLHQQFVVENRPGASGNVATELVARVEPDGYTVMELATVNAINASLYKNLNYDFLRDIALVAGISQGPAVMEVNPKVPATTVPELIAYAKANPGKINYGSAGVGSSLHMAGELFKLMAGVDMVHVPYRGSPPALTDLLGGQLQLMFSPLPPSIEYVKSGKLRALAVTTATRSQALPDIPVVADYLPGYEASAWYGIGAPANTPGEIVNKLNAEINAGLADSKLKARLVEIGSVPFPGSPSDFGKFLATETEKWAKVIKFANIKPE
jgi:tripartite-type tricarboxylate transporter receptor subunit TctC